MWDAETMFSNDQALADAESDNIVDTGPKDAGKGHPLYLQVSTTSGASGALTVTLKTSNSADMSGAVTVATFIAPAERVAEGGVVLAAPIPSGCKRYLQLAYAGASGGGVSSGLVLGAHTANLN
ncbi:MAG: hypothetical protein LUC93_04760 [Planctomycetaceae bacterium]|nr:hypothetical protein [Planctomycetaceae bacterium]